ncbi:response regulator [Desulfobacterales bacterium HSG17]|nr:response regulator [Desulfobacterales bacterium HSG17]
MTHKDIIFVIDDKLENLQVLSEMLERNGYNVRGAPDGTTGLKMINTSLPDLILLDICMPGMNGYDVCSCLKDNEKTRDIPVIFISALGETIDKIRAFNIGGVDYITKPFQVEEVLVRVKTHLHIRKMQFCLQEKNKELRHAKEAAEASSLARSAFLANMSHEIRTPMNAISGFTSLALKNGLTHDQRDYLSKIQNASNSLLDIINDILDFSRIESEKLKIIKKEFRVQDIIEEIADMFAIQAAEKGIEMIIGISWNVPPVLFGDPGRIRQILVNLTQNALKFTDSGEIFIYIGCEKEKNDTLLLSFMVKDTGLGIPADKHKMIFSSFSQVDDSTTREYSGTGLGLAICRQLTELMNGDIRVESEPGKGSIFVCTIPFQKPDTSAGSLYFYDHALRGLKVLIADDNQSATRVIKDMVLSFGMDAETACSGAEALERLKSAAAAENPFQVLIIDWKMPGLDGIAVTESIRNNPELSHIHIILISGFAEEQEISSAIETGINVFLSKPVKPSVLYETIMRILDKKPVDLKSRSTGEQFHENGLKGVRILVAEDNEINQEVIEKILNGEGVSTDIANNGREALEAVKSKEFDGVIMDVQMPVMNGYEATKKIRKFDKDIPIIAMTAYAMQGDREKCLKAGMDDYISKPVDPDLLYGVLMKWIRPMARLTKNPIGKKSYDFDPVDGIDVHSALDRLRGDRSLFRKLLMNFAKKWSDLPQKIYKALDRGNLEQVRILAHSLKGMAGNLSALELEKAAKELEILIRENNTKKLIGIDTKVKNVEKALAKVLKSIKNLEISGKDIAVTPDVENEQKHPDISEIAPVMSKLFKSLAAHKTDSEDILESFKYFMNSPDIEKEFKELESQVMVYDFKRAQKTLETIAQILDIPLNESSHQER